MGNIGNLTIGFLIKIHATLLLNIARNTWIDDCLQPSKPREGFFCTNSTQLCSAYREAFLWSTAALYCRSYFALEVVSLVLPQAARLMLVHYGLKKGAIFNCWKFFFKPNLCTYCSPCMVQDFLWFLQRGKTSVNFYPFTLTPHTSEENGLLIVIVWGLPGTYPVHRSAYQNDVPFLLATWYLLFVEAELLNFCSCWLRANCSWITVSSLF